MSGTEQVKHAAAYSRVSTDEQTEFSLDAQIKAIREYAKRSGYAIAAEHIYIDDGVSGRKAEKRPAFMRMIAESKQKPAPFEAILVHKIDRFARSREDSVVYKSLLRKECGIKVISITESIEDDKFSVILEAMLEAMAEYYSINLAEEVKKGMTEKAMRGGLQSTPPFGYLAENNILIPIENEAAIVREVFSRFVKGEGYYPIAKWLNELGIRTHRGNRFEHRTIEYIIRNPAYIGKLRWNPTGRSRRDFDNENIIITQAGHEPLIEIETWDRAQRRVSDLKEQWKYRERPVTEHRAWLSGLVRCAACGSTLTFVKPHYWKCNGYAKGACGVSQHVRDDLLKAALIGGLKLAMEGAGELEYRALKPAESGIDETAAIHAKREKLKKAIDRLREAFLAGIETVEEYGALKKEYERGITELEDKLRLIQERNSNREEKEPHIRDILSTYEILNSPEIADADKHNAAAAIIENCVFDKTKGELVIRYRHIS